MKEKFGMWIRGREYVVEGQVQTSELGMWFEAASFRDAATGNIDESLELSDGEEGAVSDAFFDTCDPYYPTFEWLYQTEIGAYALDEEYRTMADPSGMGRPGMHTFSCLKIECQGECR